jgi:hypothetical protein
MFKSALTKIAMRTAMDLGKRLVWVGRQLWHEVTGSLFLFLALAGIPPAVREWRAPKHTRAILVSCFVVLMLYFGVTAFMRARHISRTGEPR